MIAAIRGYKAILTMPDKVSKEKQNSLSAYGAEMISAPLPRHSIPPSIMSIEPIDSRRNPKQLSRQPYDN